MDALSPKRPKIVSDGVVRKQPTQTQVKTSPRSIDDISADAVTTGIHSPLFNVNSHKHIRSHDSVSYVLWRRISLALFCSVASLLCIGFLYSRAEIQVVPKSEIYHLERTIAVSDVLSSGTVHGVWLDVPITQELSAVSASLYPDYIPMDVGGNSNSVIVLSQSDIKKLVNDEIARSYDGGVFELSRIIITSATFDPYVYTTKPSIFEAKIAMDIVARSVIDIEALRKNCAYKTILPSSTPFADCLSVDSAIASAHAVVHPWFALRIPIERAITVTVE